MPFGANNRYDPAVKKGTEHTLGVYFLGRREERGRTRPPRTQRFAVAPIRDAPCVMLQANSAYSQYSYWAVVNANEWH